MEVCTVCNRKFVQKKYLNQHMKIHQKHKPFQCSVCPKRFLRKQDKNRHERVHTVMAQGQRRITWAPRSSAPATEGPSVPGPSTAQPQPTGGAIGPSRKRRNQEPVASAASSSLGPQGSFRGPRIYQVGAAFRNATITWKLVCPKHVGNQVAEVLDVSTNAMHGKLSRLRMTRPALKLNMAIHCTFEQEKDRTVITFPPVVLVTEQLEIYPDTDLDHLLKLCSDQLQNRIAAYEGLGSG